MLHRRPALALLLLLNVPLFARQVPETPEVPRIDPAGIRGSLVIVGGGRIPSSVTERFRALAGGPDAKLVIIPTASEYAEGDVADPTDAKKRWADRGFEHVTILHTRDRRVADDPAFARPIAEANAVWFDGGDQTRLADTYLDTAVDREIHALLDRGGVVGGTSAGAAIQSKVMISGGNPVARLGEGLDLIPGAVVDQHFLARSRKPRLLSVLEHHAGLVGFGIDESTALVVQGRRLEVVGDSSVTVLIAGTESGPARDFELKPGTPADLVSLRRAARDRLVSPYPPQPMPEAVVTNGSLVIVGGGGMPRTIVEKFIELAGGPDATIVVVPTAEEGAIPGDDEQVGGVRMLIAAGAKDVRVLRGRTRGEIETPEQIEVLKRAGGVWFGGGRQWRFVDCYEGTPVVELFRGVLRRGGVIGGSSAGATIQGDFLVRGSPLGNTEMIADGYRRGFGFLPGVAIDQHFAQRNRFADLAAVVDQFPQVLGLGIDESTAVIVRGPVADVLGDGSAHFYDRRKPISPGDPDHQTVPAGGRYDLLKREPYTPAATDSNAPKPEVRP